MKKLGTKELEATVANLRQLRDRFASAEAWSAVRQIELTIDEAEAELASRRGGTAQTEPSQLSLPVHRADYS